MPDFLNPMRWLLKAEGYPPAVLFSVGLHVLVVYLMWDQDFVPDNLVDLERPEFVRATVIQENPQKLRRLEDERQRAADAAAEQRAREQAAEQRRQEEARQQAQREQEAREQREQEQQKQQELERQQEAERQRLAQQDAERQRQAEAAAERERQQQLAQEEADRIARETAAREAAAQAAAQQAASDNQAISSYMAVIYDTVSNNWILPPSARNGMTAVVRLNLVPTGEIVNYTIVTSSGDGAFDRSVMQAVGQSERFPELQQMPSRIFETQFRIVDLTFRPEDLLR